jgi:hypothetical protein
VCYLKWPRFLFGCVEVSRVALACLKIIRGRRRLVHPTKIILRSSGLPKIIFVMKWPVSFQNIFRIAQKKRGRRRFVGLMGLLILFVSERIRVSKLVCYYKGPCVFSYSSFSLVILSANDSPGGLSACGYTLDINIFASSSLLTFIFSGPMIHFLACCYIFDQQKKIQGV